MTEAPLSVYFHGVPGGAGELQLFGPDIAARCSDFVIAQRDFPELPSGADRYAAMASALRVAYPARPLKLIGFSMGASAALRVAPLLGDQVKSIDLISAAAPLSLNDYLEGMAGAPVFRCARDHPFAFGIMAKGQSLLAKAKPSFLYSALFSSAQGCDLNLREDERFKTTMIPMLRDYFANSLKAYRTEILSYVGDWSGTLSRVTQPVSIYHGQVDNWSPPEMAADLAQRLGDCQRLETCGGCSHYSALEAYLRLR